MKSIFTLGLLLLPITLVNMQPVTCFDTGSVVASSKVGFKPKSLSEEDCITEALWHEIRGGTDIGMKAVLSVIYNRKQQEGSYCKAVHKPYAFSYRNHVKPGAMLVVDLNSLQPKDRQSYTKAKVLAKTAVKSDFKPLLKPDVMWYATVSTKNYWTRKMQVVAKYDGHYFYRKPSKVQKT